MILAFNKANTKLCIYFCIIRRNHLPYCMNILVLHLILRCSELQADTKAKQSIIFFISILQSDERRMQNIS